MLEGTFSDESGDYKAGTYIRNPHNSKHKPYSRKGCKLFVKLRQFDVTDNEKVIINTDVKKWLRISKRTRSLAAP